MAAVATKYFIINAKIIMYRVTNISMYNTR